VSNDEHLFQVLAFAAIDPESSKEGGTQASFDAAFAGYTTDPIEAEAAAFSITGELPFDPAARRRRVILTEKANEARWLVVAGSPETLLEIAQCASAAQYRDIIASEGKQGLRHLGLAYRKLAPASGAEPTDILAEERDLTFLGFASLADPLRPSTPHTIELAKQLGVAIKILTGDSPEVAGYVAAQIKLNPDGARTYSGDELAKMAPADLAKAATESSVFARVSPEQKFSIIKALKTHEIVGYQGDGINDAPALKLADVGIAVDSAIEVAKANADIILLDKDLGVIINAIRDGRTIFANINKYVKYTMVGNFGNFFALAILYLLATSLPLLPRQILLVSLLTDLPLVAISTDNVYAHELERPERYDAHALLMTSVALGTLTSFFELAFFAGLHGQTATTRQTDFYLFLSLTQLIVIASIRNRDHFWRAVRPSAPLAEAMVLTAVATIAIIYVPPLAHIFSFRAVSLSDVGLVLAVVAIYLIVLDSFKVWYYKLQDRRASGQPRPSPGTGHRGPVGANVPGRSSGTTTGKQRDSGRRSP
jgi:P-type Mg2+ transporter